MVLPRVGGRPTITIVLNIYIYTHTHNICIYIHTYIYIYIYIYTYIRHSKREAGWLKCTCIYIPVYVCSRAYTFLLKILWFYFSYINISFYNSMINFVCRRARAHTYIINTVIYMYVYREYIGICREYI